MYIGRQKILIENKPDFNKKYVQHMDCKHSIDKYHVISQEVEGTGTC